MTSEGDTPGSDEPPELVEPPATRRRADPQATEPIDFFSDGLAPTEPVAEVDLPGHEERVFDDDGAGEARADDPGAATGELGSLFAEDNFVEYEDEPVLPLPPRPQRWPWERRARRAAGVAGGAHGAGVGPAGWAAGADRAASAALPSMPPEPLREPPVVDLSGLEIIEAPEVTPMQRVLIAVAIGLVAVVALVALFVLGTRLPTLSAHTAASGRSASTVTLAPDVAPLATASLGRRAWTALGGGECVAPFRSPWASTFAVVECSGQHAAQLVYRASLATGVHTAYPGAAAVRESANTICQTAGVLDSAAAAKLTDLQMVDSYPLNEAQWNGGQRDVFCFIERAKAAPISGSLLGAAQSAEWATRAASQVKPHRSDSTGSPSSSSKTP